MACSVIYDAKEADFHLLTNYEWSESLIFYNPLPGTCRPVQPGSPVNLTGCSARMQVRSQSGILLATLDTTDTPDDTVNHSGTIVLGGIAGTIDLFLPESFTELITWRIGYYDLKIIYSDGSAPPFLGGRIFVKTGNTQ